MPTIIFANALEVMWASKTPQQAYDLLAKPDIAVTNQTDKVKQLPKIQNLANEVYETVRAAAGSGLVERLLRATLSWPLREASSPPLAISKTRSHSK